MAARPWWERFYDELGPEVDRIFAAQQAQAEAEVDFALRVLGVRPPAHILDLACGTGRHSLSLARRGFAVVGVDRSPAQLAAAAGKPGAERVRWVEADLRRLPELPPADAAVCFFNSWGYFPDDADNRAVLAQVRARLRPGGHLLLDTLNGTWWLRRVRRGAAGYVAAGTGVAERLAYDPRRRLLHAQWRVVLDGGRRSTYVIHQRLYAPGEVRAMLHAAGFRVVAVYGDAAGGAARASSGRAIFVARAAGGDAVLAGGG